MINSGRTDIEPGSERAPRAIRARPGLALGLGIVLVILGAFAVALPNVATFAAEVMIGWLFILSGLVYAYSVITLRGVWRIASATLISVLSLATGVLLLLYPLHGVLTLTMVMAAYFAAVGVLRLVHAAQHRHLRGWLWGLLSGIAGIGIAVLIFLGWPGTALWTLGLLLGIDLLFSGWALIMLYGALRQRPDDHAPPAVP